MEKETEWFQNWFNTPYYHILYDYRKDDEARFFMKNLINYLDLKPNGSILDLPCGKGRHAVFLYEQGFQVTGADLSKNSIEHAKQLSADGLRFVVHDMRDRLNGKYDAIFNLFTSFGYFNQEATNVKVLENFKLTLNQDGHLVIDFFNLNRVINRLTPYRQIEKGGFQFDIKNYIDDGFVVKEILVDNGSEKLAFQEKVQALSLEKFETFAKMADLEIQHVFGDYQLNAFDKNNSERLILIMQ
mgnify:CR=1 FL=1